MQDVNNDMDNLFRKAAEQYPLKTDGADWQKVFAGLQDASMPVAEEKEKKKRRFLWLFLLLPLGLLWAVYYKGNDQLKQQTAVIKTDTKQEDNNSTKPDFTTSKKASSESVSSNNTRSEHASVDVNGNQRNIAVSNNIASVASADKEKSYQKNRSDIHATSSAFLKNRKEDFSYKGVTPDENILPLNNTINNQVDSHKNNFSAQQPDTLANRIDKTDGQNNSRQTTDETVQAKTDSTTSVIAKADSVANSNSNANKSKLVKVKPRIQTGFYAGLLGSFDVSTIKLQRINKTGHGFELLLGYRFSKRVSVESGINWTDKKYYSTGKYFDKTRTGIPEASKIIYTNGSCAMFEIPAVVKYDFAQKKKSNWFATAGLSSYIMNDEKYTYYANHSGNYYFATKKYSHSGSNLFSVASLSLGYQLQLNGHLSLRAEPYIKMPLSGIGIANLPIASLGITAGFTRSF